MSVQPHVVGTVIALITAVLLAVGLPYSFATGYIAFVTHVHL